MPTNLFTIIIIIAIAALIIIESLITVGMAEEMTLKL
jgi:hypothetical protein